MAADNSRSQRYINEVRGSSPENARIFGMPFKFQVVVGGGGTITSYVQPPNAPISSGHYFHAKSIRGVLNYPTVGAWIVASIDITNAVLFQVGESNSSRKIFEDAISFAHLSSGPMRLRNDLHDSVGYPFAPASTIVVTISYDSRITGLTAGTYNGELLLLGTLVKK